MQLHTLFDPFLLNVQAVLIPAGNGTLRTSFWIGKDILFFFPPKALTKSTGTYFSPLRSSLRRSDLT